MHETSTEADKVDHVGDNIEVTGNLFGQSAAASQGKHVNIMHNWGEPERAPHSRDLHHFFVSYVRLTSVDPRSDSV